MMNLLRRIASSPGLRTVLLRPGVRRVLASVLAARFLVGACAVSTPFRLVFNEIFARGRVRQYTVRRTSVPVVMQHGRDLQALAEIFRGGEYDIPPELMDRLRSVRRVADVGANVGMFSAWALGQWPEAEIVAFEPDPENVAVYERWRATAGGSVHLVPAAAAPATGEMPFLTGRGAGSQQVASELANVTVPAVDVFPHLANVDLIKLDIEGGEWPILADPRLAGLHHTTLVMEFHRVGAPSLPAAEAAAGALVGAGFTVGRIHRNHWGHGVLWAWKD